MYAVIVPTVLPFASALTQLFRSFLFQQHWLSFYVVLFENNEVVVWDDTEQKYYNKVDQKW